VLQITRCQLFADSLQIFHRPYGSISMSQHLKTHKGMKETLGTRIESSPTTIGYFTFATRTGSITVVNLLGSYSSIAPFGYSRPPPRKHERHHRLRSPHLHWMRIMESMLSSAIHEGFHRTSLGRRFLYNLIGNRLHVAYPIYTFVSIEIKVSYRMNLPTLPKHEPNPGMQLEAQSCIQQAELKQSK
jgi:hypothetical protein